MRMRRSFATLALVCTVSACDGDHHGHEHPHPHGADAEAPHAAHGDMLSHDPGAAGHPEDSAEHGHGGGVVVTDFTPYTELFVEFPPLAVGRESPFAAHFTRLEDFRPVSAGQAIVRLEGDGAGATFSACPSPTPGIFRPVVIPKAAGERRLLVELKTDAWTSVHDLGSVTIYADPAAADAALPEEAESPGLIPFLKEQQWQLDFATAAVVRRSLSRSVAAPAELAPLPSADIPVVAPTAGFVVPAAERLPELGAPVATGDVLVRVVPRLGGADDRAALAAEAAGARAVFEAAHLERVRLAGLVEEGAVAPHRLESAQADERSAEARLAAVRARLAALQGGAGAGSGFAVRAPGGGRVVDVRVRPGAFVEAGTEILRISDDARLRLTARVAEFDAVDMGKPQGLWFTVAGRDAIYESGALNGRLVAALTTIDPVTRTAPVVFEFDNPGGRLRPGMGVQAHLRTATTFEGPAVPVSALVDDAGKDVVFVMVDGENWERRIVEVALRDGGYAGIRTGLEPGERVVSRGAYLVHLAASGPAAAGHGHAH